VRACGPNSIENEFAIVRKSLKGMGLVENAETNGFTVSRTQCKDRHGEMSPWQGVDVKLRKEGVEVKFSVAFPENASCKNPMYASTAIRVLVGKEYDFHEPTKKIIAEVKDAIAKETNRIVKAGTPLGDGEVESSGAPPGSIAA